jgi:hypothetical protein
LTRKLILVDLVLLVLIGLLGSQLRREWRRENSREQTLYRYQVKQVAPPHLNALAKLNPFEAGAYASVAQNNLFSKDRNPNVILDPVEPPKPKPQPPYPVARGVMLWDGAPPTIVLSEKSGGAQKGYHPGDSIGEWKVVSIDNTHVVFGWDGKEYEKRIDELLDHTPIEMAAAAPAPVAPAPKSNTAALSPSSSAKSGPGADVGGGYHACIPGDDAPAGTVVDGLKKVISQSPFSGSICRWESAK